MEPMTAPMSARCAPLVCAAEMLAQGEKQVWSVGRSIVTMSF